MEWHSEKLLRPQLWSPVQNTALWIAWWLHAKISTDELIDAFLEIQGSEHALYVPDTDFYAEGIAEVLRAMRGSISDTPILFLILAGPGDVPPLPANSAAAHKTMESGSGILIADATASSASLFIPIQSSSSIMEWWQYEVDFLSCRMLLESRIMGIGEADTFLRESMHSASASIEQAYRSQGVSLDIARLKVGSLTDAFALPGLPPHVTPRAVGLMARADTVSAIIDVARQMGKENDPYLLPLLKALRIARVSAVDYAQRELLR